MKVDQSCEIQVTDRDSKQWTKLIRPHVKQEHGPKQQPKNRMLSQANESLDTKSVVSSKPTHFFLLVSRAHKKKTPENRQCLDKISSSLILKELYDFLR